MTIKLKLGGCVLACMAVLAAAVGGLVQLAGARSERVAAEAAVVEATGGLAALEQADVGRLEAALAALAANPALAEAWRAGDRARLLAVAHPIYEVLRRDHDVTHLSLHAPSLENVLRVHAPERSGGRVDRVTLAEAARTGARAAGKELGLTAFALRVVVPWRVGGELVGYLEAGEEIDHLLSRLQLRTGDEYALLLDKRVVAEAAWAGAYGARKPWGPGPLLLVQATSGLAGAAPPPAPGGEGAAGEVVHREGRALARGRVPLRDAAGQVVGQVVVERDLTALHGALEKERLGVLLVLLGMAALMTALLPWLVQRLVFARLERMAAALEAQGMRLAAGDGAPPLAPAPSPGAVDELARVEGAAAAALASLGRHLEAARRG
jgi:hypothetical protein